jgi:hypothetical protein
MGKPEQPALALLFAGILYNDDNCLNAAKKTLIENYGNCVLETPSFSWNYSDYYNKEFGNNIMRTFMFFEKLISPEQIIDIKLQTNQMEESFSEKGKRKVNIDPGYLTLSNIVLATTKNYSHRIYLGKGIYGEVTLIYKNNTYSPYIFTYQDYQDAKSIEMFLEARKYLKRMLGNKTG